MEKPVETIILIVDDEKAGRETLEAVLEGEGYRLEFAESGPRALELCSALLPDVVLLDVMMPGMTGFEACQAIRDDVRIAEIPIILVTALDDHASMLRGLEVGADDFITKPFDRFELRARLLGITRLNRYRKLLEKRTGLEAAHQRLEEAYDDTIEGWSRAMDLRDRETEGHTQRVTEMTIRMAREMGISEEQIVHVRRGALLHDMGKLGVPDQILLKPGELSDEEWETMRMHPIYAREMLEKIEYLHPALDIPVYHHEKWDGSGYPSGLKGEQIPLAARLFAVVDVWDALLSDRPYRPAWPKERVVAHIQAQAGKHFDPRIVDKFIEIFGKA